MPSNPAPPTIVLITPETSPLVLVFSRLKIPHIRIEPSLTALKRLRHATAFILDATENDETALLRYLVRIGRPILYIQPTTSTSPAIQTIHLTHFQTLQIAYSKDPDLLRGTLQRFIERTAKPLTSGRARGKFIVIDGGDGSGKGTQATLLVEHLKKVGIKVKYVDFPQYDSSLFGALVGRFLTGEFGELRSVSPYLVSLAYALDRTTAAPSMKAWLNRGGWIVANRYTSSNLAHQSARFTDKHEQMAYLAWAYAVEFYELGLPREDVVLYLQVPARIASKLTLKKAERHYTRSKKDIAERDLQHQMDAGTMYTLLAKKFRHWNIIKCIDRQGGILPIATIHQKVVQSLHVPSKS